MTVSRRLRFEILRRDGHTCRYCGAKAPDVTLTVDHVVPVALGGGDDPRNLVTACQDCNSGKSSMPADSAVVEDVDATAMMFSKALERAAELRRRDLTHLALGVDCFQTAWIDTFGTLDGLPYDWATSIETFIGQGFIGREITTFVEVTGRKFGRSSNDTWRYFCGCCWRELSDRQELARRLIEDGEV